MLRVVADNQPVRRDRLIRLPEVESLTGLKKSSIYGLMQRGEFPRCVAVTQRAVAWPESACLQWIQDRIQASRESAGARAE